MYPTLYVFNFEIQFFFKVVFGIVALSVWLSSKIAGAILIATGIMKFASDVILVNNF